MEVLWESICILLAYLNMKKIFAFSMIFLPMLASAQLSVGEQNLTGVVRFIQSAMNAATGLITAAAVVWFMWGVFTFIRAAGDEEARKEGSSKMIAGIIGIAVIVSVWGLVRWVTSTTGTGGATAVPTVTLPRII